mgnify:CR=1 FL=1
MQLIALGMIPRAINELKSYYKRILKQNSLITKGEMQYVSL